MYTVYIYIYIYMLKLLPCSEQGSLKTKRTEIQYGAKVGNTCGDKCWNTSGPPCGEGRPKFAPHHLAHYYFQNLPPLVFSALAPCYIEFLGRLGPNIHVFQLPCMFSVVFQPSPNTGTSPIRFVLKIRAVLRCLCVPSSELRCGILRTPGNGIL